MTCYIPAEISKCLLDTLQFTYTIIDQFEQKACNERTIDIDPEFGLQLVW